jgi:uncharacterized membrane protein
MPIKGRLTGGMVWYLTAFIVLSLILSYCANAFFGITPKTTIRVVFGLFYVMFLPGYALCWLFFPDDSEINGIERLGLSMGLSIPVSLSVVLFADQYLKVPLSASNIAAVIGAAIFLMLFAGLIWRTLGSRRAKT